MLPFKSMKKRIHWKLSEFVELPPVSRHRCMSRIMDGSPRDIRAVYYMYMLLPPP